MTRILISFDNQTILLIDSHDDVQTITAEVNAGRWLPPAPFGKILQCSGHTLRATPSGDVVLIAATSGKAESPAENISQKNFSHQQWQILRLMGDGLTNKQIARRMGLSYSAIVYGTRKLKERLHVRTRNAILMKAAEHGLIVLKKKKG